ncbi:YIP1 family protein [Deinococcus sp. SDU3-2]|uniref:YIP1 family protein n=1 Tax=Deinococcus terrestris TaxID=2651870 RepID=A0A7X1NUY4_9DEIO|nr:YIP1 family protein [Deinococcus terrestris]MPY66272.1 YIP1 family protein [Deinococcus terrestris]
MSAPTRIQATFADMFAQSAAVLTRPSPRTFELFERRGGVRQAFLYVGLAALASALIAALFAPFHGDVTVLGQFFSRLLLIPLQFGIFTGAVYLLGRRLFGGTGRYEEVAYTFSLFYVPLSLLGTLLGIIPILGWLVSLLVTVALVAFGYLAVQSSMNLRDPVHAGVTLLLSAILNGLLVSLLLAPLMGG